VTGPQGAVPGLGRAVARARAGKTLDVGEVTTLLQARGEALGEVMEVASRLRDQGLADAGRPGVITYSRKVFVPLTRLCRDRCHYCTFATAPARLPAPFLSPDEVLALVRAGANRECKEALFTLGDRPEDRWPQAREWLDAHGYDSTSSYLRAMAVLVLEETGLLPHLNPGVMSWDDLQRLKAVAPSMGLMLETTSTRLLEPGQPHHGSPDKDPAVRLRVIADAGRLSIPFTTGLLVGIGETATDRAESLFALRSLSRQYGHVQEVIVQNFRAKADTAMRAAPDLAAEEYLATVAVARVVLGSSVRLQVPPNLSDPQGFQALVAAGIDDWGGVSPVTPDHVNPERPWPALEVLGALTSASGFTLRERLTVHPSYVRAGEPWIDPRVLPHVQALADPVSGLGREGQRPTGLPWQEPDPEWDSSGRTLLNLQVDTEGRLEERRTDFDEVYGNWASLREQLAADPVRRSGDGSSDGSLADGSLSDGDLRAALRRAEHDPASLLEVRHEALALALFEADGQALAALASIADTLRSDTVGETVTYVVNRNINFTNVCYTGCRFCAFAQRRTDADAFTLSLDEVADRAEEAWRLGATEVCMQGGIDPLLPGTAYSDLVRAVKARVPQLHVHAFSPMEVVNGAARTGLSIEEFLVSLREAGLDTLPGTAAEILDDDVRWILTKGKLPAASWVEVVTTAHRLGLRSSATMMYGHVDRPRHWLQHFRVLAQVQDTATTHGAGGFTEFVPLPFVHRNAPVYLAGLARPGPTRRENLVVHAMARLLLHGRVSHVQTSWVKLGVAGTQAMLRSGADDLGGTLMDETISRMAGSEHGSAKTVAELEAIAAALGRPTRQRSTVYGPVPDRADVAPGPDTPGVRRTVTNLRLDAGGPTRV
jgi:FO synthase